MAEAHAIATLHDALTLNSSAVSFLNDEGGLTLTVTIPRPRAIVRNLVRRIKRIQNGLVNAFFPLGWIVGIVVMLVIIANVLLRDETSWWRQGPLAEFVWNMCLYMPFFMSLPRYGRIAVAAACAGFWVALGLALVQRYILRLLLQYHGWLYLDRVGGKMPILDRLFFLGVKLLNGSSPRTYSFQGSLPRLPVPTIQRTCERYLESIKPLQTAEEYAKTVAQSQQFLANEGPKLQRLLKLKSWWSYNYVSDWWEAYVYLRGRSPIMVNSNYYCLDMAWVVPTHIREARAAVMLVEIMKYKRLLEHERIPPIMVRGMVPMCMDQYKRSFSTTRTPGRENDVVRHWDSADSRHVVIMYRGTFHTMSMFTHEGELLSAWELEDQLNMLVDAVDKEPARTGEAGIAALTGWNRARWGEAREMFFGEGVNRRSLEIIERAIMCLSLDENAPTDWTKQGKLSLHGTGTSLWFDKSLTLISFKNGRCSINVEHSWADALVVGNMWEYAMLTGERLTGYAQDGHAHRPAGAVSNKKKKFTRLRWDLPELAIATIGTAVDAAQLLLADLDLAIFVQDGYGKGFMKKCRVSPDSYVQMALQLAWYRDQSKFCLTYEASSTRLFRNGRTETVRPVSEHSCAFVRAMDNPKATNAQRRELLQKAVEWHSEYARDAMCGKGIDRHLFALYVVSVGRQIESSFLKEAVSQPWMLSTSQQPQTQTDRWDPQNNPADAERVSPGGGFGPVADDGYGVSYMIVTDAYVFFHVSSKVSSPKTDSKRFQGQILKAFVDMKAAFDSK